MRRRSAYLGLSITGVVVAAVCWFFGADVWHSVVIGALAVSCVLVWLSAPQHVNTMSRSIAPTAKGARSDVLTLSWSLRGRRGRVGFEATNRVRGLARTRLARHGLDLANPADRPRIERLIGTAATATLTAPGGKSPTLRSMLRCLDALEHLAPPSQNASTDRGSRP